MSMHEEFIAITGATLEEALTWLEIGQYDLQSAVELFLSSNQQTETNLNSFQQQDNIPMSDDFADDSAVRMPDSVKRARLVDETFMVSNKVSRPAVGKSAFTTGSGFLPKNDKEKTLSDIFKAPIDLMTHDSFDGVLELAKSNDQWLLVNLQRDSEFQCHLLNRDFWADESVRDMVLSSFVFWQQQETSDGGAQYIERYKVSQFPHVSIVDPRTGGSVWRHDGDFKKAELAEKLQDFLGMQSCPSESRIASRLMRKLTAGSTTSSSSSSTSQSVDQEMVEGGVATAEEAELQEAIRMSLQQDGDQNLDAVALTESSVEVVGKDVIKRNGFLVSELSHLSIAEAPSVETQWIKTAFRLPSGGKAITHTFSSSTPLIDVAVFAAQQIVAVNGSPTARFEVLFNFPQEMLSEMSNFSTQTLSSVGIVTGTAFVVKLL